MPAKAKHIPRGLLKNYRAGQRWFDDDFTNYDISEQVLTGLKTHKASCLSMTAKGAHLELSSWDLANITKAKFDGANLAKARFFGVEGSGPTFISAHLDAANFARSDLGAPNFEFCIGLAANFGEAKIRHGKFTYSVLSGSEWQHSIVQASDFTHANLVGANFYHAALDTTCFVWVDAPGLFFRHASAPRTDFSFSKVHGSDFSGANLIGSKFREAVLSDCSFVGTDLRDVDFTDSMLDGARFDHALLIGAKLSRYQLDRANLRPIEKAFKSYLSKITEKHLTIIWIELINGRIEGSFRIVEGNATRGSDPNYFARALGPQVAPFIPWDRVRGDRAREAERAKTILSVPTPKGLAERWISAIRFGMTRENNAIVYKTHQWIVEWLVDTYGEGILHENIPGLELERPGPEGSTRNAERLHSLDKAGKLRDS